MSSRVPGPVNEWPGRCISPGYLAQGSLILLVKEFKEPTRSPPCFSAFTNWVLVIPQTAHSPLSIGRPLLLTKFVLFLVSVFILHFTQYISPFNILWFIFKTMEVIDLSWNDSLEKRSKPSITYSIRGLIVGKSGCGKTTLLLNLLLRPCCLDYNNLRVFGKSLFQPEYQILKKAFDEKLSKEAILRLFNCQDDIRKLRLSSIRAIEELATESENKNPDIKCEFFKSEDDVPDPREPSSKKRNLMIFDDLQLE